MQLNIRVGTTLNNAQDDLFTQNLFINSAVLLFIC